MSKNSFLKISILVIAGFALPVLMYCFVTAGAPSITPAEAEALVLNEKADTALIDIRPADEFRQYSINGSVNMPYRDIFRQNDKNWKKELDGKKHILVLCKSGISSISAVKELRAMGYGAATGVEGGLDAWILQGGYCCKNGTEKTALLTEEKPGTFRRNFTLLEQTLIVAAAFGLKPVYVLLSFIIIVLLWKDRDADLSALKWAMISFFIGENACTANFVFFKMENLFFEYLHCYGMVVSFGLITYALMKAVDTRIIKYTDAEDKCAMLGLCKRCYKYTDVSCTILHLYLFAIPATAVLALIPLSAEIRGYFYAGDVFGNETVFGHSTYQQIYEARVLPVMALVLLIFSWLVLIVKKEAGFNSAKIWFAAGAGALGFSIFRFMLFWSYDYNSLWAEVWEEATEFLFVAAVLFIVLKRRAVLKRINQGNR